MLKIIDQDGFAMSPNPDFVGVAKPVNRNIENARELAHHAVHQLRLAHLSGDKSAENTLMLRKLQEAAFWGGQDQPANTYTPDEIERSAAQEAAHKALTPPAGNDQAPPDAADAPDIVDGEKAAQ